MILWWWWWWWCGYAKSPPSYQCTSTPLNICRWQNMAWIKEIFVCHASVTITGKRLTFAFCRHRARVMPSTSSSIYVISKATLMYYQEPSYGTGKTPEVRNRYESLYFIWLIFKEYVAESILKSIHLLSLPVSNCEDDVLLQDKLNTIWFLT